MTEIRPLGTRVIVKKDEPEDKTSSGIVLAGEAKRKPIWGEIVAVGPGTEEEPMFLKVGDKVVFPDKGGKDIVVDDVDYSIYRQREIVGIVTITEEE